MGNTKNVLKAQDSSVLVDGHEMLSPEPSVPIATIGHGSKDHELQRIKQMIRGELSDAAQKNNYESFEEANDFEVDDDFDGEMEDTRYMKEEYLQPQTPQGAQDISPPLTQKGGGEHVATPKPAPEVAETE